MNNENTETCKLAEAITRAASQQTYNTIRWLVDDERRAQAFKAYAYFRWVDDQLDQQLKDRGEGSVFVRREEELIERCYSGERPQGMTDEERMLADIIRGDSEKYSGLQAYIRNMMAVMAFDAERKGRLISEERLSEYTRWLSTAVTEALHYFIGHDCATPHGNLRYQAATGAHITHMLRDTWEDVAAGYYNIPAEYLKLHRIEAWDMDSAAYRQWVHRRVDLAHECFQAGREYLGRIKNLRCRLAGCAYIARFQSVLERIRRDDFRLRIRYKEHNRLAETIWVSLSGVGIALHAPRYAGN